jgi:type II secretory pathway pseudopilin PulG
MDGKMKKSRGFTLMEVLVPIIIVVLAVIGLLTSFVMGRVHTAVSRHRILALNAIRGKLEEVKSLGYDALNHYSPNPDVESYIVLDSGQNEESETDDLTCTRTTQVSDNDGDGTLEITVTVTWQERVLAGEQTYTENLYTLVAPTRLTNR